MGADVSKRVREKFKQHRLERCKLGRVVERPWINGGRPSVLFRCTGNCKVKADCDWLGWVAIEDLQLMKKDQA